jgi:hypothetical protein
MRNIYDVIRQKETQIQDIQKELDALRLAARLLSEDENGEAETPKMRVAAVSSPAALRTDAEILLAAPHRPFP